MDALRYAFLLRSPLDPRGLQLQRAAEASLRDHVVSRPELIFVVDDLPVLLRPGRAGQGARDAYGVQELRAPSGVRVGWDIPAGPDHVLVSPASSLRHPEGYAEGNPFTEAYSSWIREHRPTDVYAGDFWNQGRWVPDLVKVRDALVDSGALVHARNLHERGRRMSLDLAGSPDDRLRWDEAAAQAEGDWKLLLSRMARLDRRRTEEP